MIISEVSAVAWTLPLIRTFAIAQRTTDVSKNVLITVRANDGFVGIGECAPVQYVAGENVDSVIAAISESQKHIVGLPMDDLNKLLLATANHIPHAPAARAGIEMALYDLWARTAGISLATHFGPSRHILNSDITLSIASPEQTAERAEEARDAGIRNMKVKVGAVSGFAEDVERIVAVLNRVPDAKLKVDANQAFSPEEAVSFMKALEINNIAITLLEQPVDAFDVKGLKYVKDRVDVPVFADESACTAAQVRTLIAEDAVDGINVKLMKSGITEALEIIELCQRHQKQLMFGCMLESCLGIAAAVCIAASTGAFDYIDLDSHLLLRPVPELSNACFVDNEGKIEIVQTPGDGWGITYQQARL